MTPETVRKLHADRMNAVEELRSLGEEVGSDEPTAEQLAKEERLNATITELGHRVDSGLESLSEEARDIERAERIAALPTPEPTAKVDGERQALVDLLSGERTRPVDLHPEARDLLAGTATDGAELVPTTLYSQLHKYIEDYANVVSDTRIIRTAGGETLNLPVVSTNAGATWEGEGDAIAEADPQFATVSLSAYKLARLTQVSSELLQDSAFNVSSFVVESAAQALALAIDTAVVTGAGTTQPLGFDNETPADTTAGTAAVTADELIDAYHTLAPPFRANAKWYMADSTIQAIRKLSNAGTVDYVWQPGLAAGQPDRLLGYPVVATPDLPAMATGVVFAAFGDLSKAYTTRMAGSVRVDRSSDFAFANDLETFRFIVRLDGKVHDSRAISVIDNA